MTSLEGRKAIVTGVSKGIGFATVNLLLENNVTVAGWGRTAPDISDPNFHFFKTDVGDFESVKDSFELVISELGSDIDILVNNAGIGYEGPFEELPVESWVNMFDTNVHGIFYCSKLLVPYMKEREVGHIINIASIAGTTGIPGMAGYCGTKHAVKGISHSMYKELREFGVKVTCIYPGSVKTNFFDKIDSIQANDNMMMPEDIAGTIIHALQSSENYHHVDIEVRPLRPKGRRK